MKKLSLLLLLIIFQNIFAQLSPGIQTVTIGGRNVDIVTPANYNPAQSYPVVFFLHGLGGNKGSLQDAGAVTAAQIVGVFPEGTSSFLLNGGRAWNSLTNIGATIGNVDDVAFLNSVYADVKTRMGATFNPNKVFSMGFSNGGSMNLKMVKNSNIFKAVIIGSMAEEANANGAIPATATKVPMLFIFGMNDQVVPFTGGQGSFGPLASFEPIRTTVQRWAQNNTGVSDVYQQIYFPGNSTISEYHFREYRDEASKKASVYLYMIPNAQHDFTATSGFNYQNIMTTAMRFFGAPVCYGLSRQKCAELGVVY